MNDKKFKVSIIIVNFKTLDFIESCINSIEKYCNDFNYEIIVANNDDEYQYFSNFKKKYLSVKCIQNDGNWGFSNGCNLGASIASGEYFLFLNPDTKIIDGQAISGMVNHMDANKLTGACSCSILNSNGEEKLLEWNNPWYFIKWIKFLGQKFRKNNELNTVNSHILTLPVISGAVFMINSDDFRILGGWPQNDYWMYSEDRHMCYQITTRLKKEITLLRNYKIFHFWGASSNKSSINQRIEMIISRHNFINLCTKNPERSILLTIYILKNIIVPFLKVFTYSLILNKKNLIKHFQLLKGVLVYYYQSLKRKTFRSIRLEISS